MNSSNSLFSSDVKRQNNKIVENCHQSIKLNKQNNAYIKHTLRVIAIFNCLSFQPKKKRLCQIRHWGVSPLVYGWGHEVGHAYKLQVKCFYSAEFKNNVEVGLSR